jgi:ribosomal protein L37AE/L43A
MTLKFQRKKEDFVCEKCKKKVKGTGYTNHCTFCLWSKHVDNYPGDRTNDCGGLMEPIGVELEKNIYHLIFRCKKCGVNKRNKVQYEDDFARVIEIVKKQNSNL